MSLKMMAARILESHPFGYRLAVFLLDNFDFLLPHEMDYHGFPVLARKIDFPYKTILDLGANRGHSGRAFLKLLSGWRVVSFEANPNHSTRLRHIKENNAGRYDFVIGAVSDKNGGEVSFYVPRYAAVDLHSAGALDEKDAREGAGGAYPKLADKLSMQKTPPAC
ncbi:FkbM family methyltransferase [Ferrovibrio xuzhouensis]|uniref:FkbM family methyltransferase n=1 Tax=Ferrovibrio xuzhouensis TaxID=1576914 RepID=A0ABV7VBQ3_9PROT